MQNDQNQTNQNLQLKQKEILAEYKRKSDEITYQMLKILMKAQKKADNETYRKLLQELEKEKANK